MDCGGFQVCYSIASYAIVCRDPLDVNARSFAHEGEVKPNDVTDCIRLAGQTTGESNEERLAVS